MLPSVAQHVAVARRLATCCRSRFGVAFRFRELFWQLQSGCDSRSALADSDELRER